MAGHNISSLGVKGIAKRAAKDTGKAVVGDYEKRKVPKMDQEIDTTTEKK